MRSLLDEIKLFFGFIDEKKTIEEAPELQEKTPFKGSLVNAQSARPFASSEIKVLEPKIYEDSLNIAAYLRANKPVVVNLKSLDKQAENDSLIYLWDGLRTWAYDENWRPYIFVYTS